MASSKFDYSKLSPAKEWDESKLNPIEEEENYNIPYKKPTGVQGIAEDIKGIPGNIVDYLIKVPQMAGESYEQIKQNPIQGIPRAERSLMGGLLEGLKQTYNLPLHLNTYLGSKDIPFFKQMAPYAEKLKIGETGLQKLIQGEPQKGDELLNDIGMLLGPAKITKSIPSIGNKILNLGERYTNLRNAKKYRNELGELEGQHENISQTHGQNVEEFNLLKNILEGQPGFETSNPNKLKRKAAEAQQKLQALQIQVEGIPEHLRATEQPVQPEKTPLSIVEPVRAGEKPEISEEPIRQAENLLKTNAQKSAEHEAAISQHLGEGNAHRKRVAEKLNPILEARQAEIGSGYDKYQEGLKGKQVTLSNPRDAKAITADIQQRLKQGDTSSKEMAKLTDELANLGKGETMPADKFVSAYRSLRSMAQRTRSSAYGKSPQEFDRLIEAADAMDADVNKMAKIIDSGLGEENLEELHKLNQRYATEVAPLFKNKFFQHMQANNKAPTNMIEQLTNEPYIKSTNPNKITGTQILNEIIKGDPELLQNVVGERFAHKPESLHQWDEAANNFIQHMPELQELRRGHFEAKQAESQSKLDLEKAKQQHQMAREQADIAHIKETQVAQEKTRQKKTEVHKENQAKKKEYEQKSEHFKIQKQIKDLEDRYIRLKDNAEKMREKANKKNISLKEKLDLENKISKIKKDLSKIDDDKAKLKKIGSGIKYGGAALILGAPALSYVKNKIIRK